MQAVDQCLDVNDLGAKQVHDIHIAERTDSLQIHKRNITICAAVVNDLLHIGKLLAIQIITIQEASELGLYGLIRNTNLNPQEG